MRAHEATTNHEENKYGLFSLSADTGATSGSSLLLYAMAGIAVLGTPRLPDTQPAPIVVRPLPCPTCTSHNPGATQEVLSSLLPVQLQSQIMRENTRILTDVQDVTSDASIRMPAATSTPIKPPQSTSLPARAQYGTSAYGRPTYTVPPYSTPLSRSLPHTADRASQTKPKRTLAATFCGYLSDIEEEEDE